MTTMFPGSSSATSDVSTYCANDSPLSAPSITLPATTPPTHIPRPQRTGLPQPGRSRTDQSFTPGAPAAVSDHGRVDRTFVEKNQFFHVHSRQALFPILTPGYDVRPVPLGRVEGLFFSVSFIS